MKEIEIYPGVNIDYAYEQLKNTSRKLVKIVSANLMIRNCIQVKLLMKCI